MKRFLACLFLLLGLSPSFAQFNGASGIYALNGQTFGLTTTRLKIISGGTGYALGDTLTLTCPQIGAANPVPATVTVSSVSSGAITGVTVTSPGTYTAIPSTGDASAINGVCTFAQASTSGSGSGAVISTLLAFNATGGTGGITNGSTPIIGATSGQYLYNNSGVVGFQTLSGGGNVSSSGTPAANNLGLWSSSTAIGPLIPGTNILTGLATNLNGTGAITGTTNPVFVTPALGTPSSGTLTNTTGFPAGSLAGTALPAAITTASGLTTVAGGAFGSGAFTAAYTCPNASTIALGCAEAGTGLLASGGVFSVAYGTTTGTALQGGGSLGTPSAGNLSNATNYPASALASGAIPGGATINDGNWSGTVLSVAHGGTGVSSPGLIAGTNITSITGTWPNQTINASGGGGAVSSVSNSDSTLTVTPTTGAVVASLNLGHANTWTSTQTFPSPAFTGTVTGAGTIPVGVISATGTPSSTTYLRGDGSWQTPAGGGVSASSPNTWTAAQTFTNSDILLLGSSTGATTFTSANAGATNYTLTFPAATDTVAVLGQTQTFSGAITHSGSTLYSGAPATFTANGQVSVFGGTTPPSPNSFINLAIGGYYASTSAPNYTGKNGGNIFVTSDNYGLALEGSGATASHTFIGYNGVINAILTATGSMWQTRANGNYVNGHLWDSGAAPASPTNGALTYSNGSGAFVMTHDASATSAMTFTLTSAANRWVCTAQNETTSTAAIIATATATVVTLTNYVGGTATNFAASAVVSGICRGV